jgi:hypothetical protein
MTRAHYRWVLVINPHMAVASCDVTASALGTDPYYRVGRTVAAHRPCPTPKEQGTPRSTAGAGVELPEASPHLPATTNLTGVVAAA